MRTRATTTGRRRCLKKACRSAVRSAAARLPMPTLLGLAIIAQWQGDWEQAREHYEEALRIAQDGGDRRSEATVLFNLGELRRGQGEEAAARPLLERSLALARDLGDPTGIARALISLGYVAAAQNCPRNRPRSSGRRPGAQPGDRRPGRRRQRPGRLREHRLPGGGLAGRPRGVCGKPRRAHRVWATTRQITGGLQRMGVLAAHRARPRGARACSARRRRGGRPSPAGVSPVAQAEWDAALACLRAALLAGRIWMPPSPKAARFPPTRRSPSPWNRPPRRRAKKILARNPPHRRFTFFSRRGGRIGTTRETPSVLKGNRHDAHTLRRPAALVPAVPTQGLDDVSHLLWNNVDAKSLCGP